MKILSEEQLNDAVGMWEHCYWGVINLPQAEWDNFKMFTVDLIYVYREKHLTDERKSLRDQGLPYLTVSRSQLHKASIMLIKEHPQLATDLLTNPDSVITETLFQFALFGDTIFG
jgi:hypothetical protein